MEATQQDDEASVGHRLKPTRLGSEPECFSRGQSGGRNHTGQCREAEPSLNLCRPIERGSAMGCCSDMKDKVQQMAVMPAAMDCSPGFVQCACGSAEPVSSHMPYCTQCLMNAKRSVGHLTVRTPSETPDTQGHKEKRSGPEQAEAGETNTLFHILPWYDVIFAQICHWLTLQEVFRFRSTCRVARDCIDEYFTVCPNVNLTQCGLKVTPNAFRMVTYNNYKLHTLILRGVKIWLTDAVLIPAFASSSHLTKVDLTECSSLTPRSVVALACRARTLQELYLCECAWVTKESVLIVAQCCPNLRKLDLTGCWAVDDDTVVTISISCQQLIFLSIAKIYGITDFSVRYLSQNCPRLQHINMHGCWRVTDSAIQLLGEHCKQLSVLQARECREVTELSLARLRKRGVKLDVQNPNRLLLGSSRSLMERLKLQV